MEIQLEISDNIKLVIDGEYKPFMSGKYSGLPENCYPDEPSEFNFDDKDAYLIISKSEKEIIKIKADSDIISLYEEEIQKEDIENK